MFLGGFGRRMMRDRPGEVEMTEPWGTLHIVAVDDEIIVTLPGTT